MLADIYFLTQNGWFFSFRTEAARHFKSGQATANKRSLVHVDGGGGGGGYNRQCAQ